MAGPAAVRLCVDTTETDGGGYDILRWNIRSRLRGRFGDRQHRKTAGVLEVWRESSIAVRAAPIYCDYPVGVAISAQPTDNRNHACLCIHRGAHGLVPIGTIASLVAGELFSSYNR